MVRGDMLRYRVAVFSADGATTEPEAPLIAKWPALVERHLHGSVNASSCERWH